MMTPSEYPTIRDKLSELMPIIIPHGSDWDLRICRLFPVEPEEADLVISDVPGFTIWQLCFSAGILWIENASKKLVLDVSWYPECDQNGCFVLKLLCVLSDDPNNQGWFRELKIVRTRSFQELFQRVMEIVNSSP